jgi:hypothetical protein
MREGAFDYKLEVDRHPVDEVKIRVLDRPAAADQAGVDDQEERNRALAREEAQFWRMVLADRVGKRAMFKLLTMLSAFESSPFVAAPNGAPDHFATFAKAGQIEQGRGVYQMLAIVARDELFALQDEFHVFSALAPRPEKA